MSRRVDLNCDLGEGGGSDREVMPLISSANIACALHAGDPTTMRRTVTLARDHGVAVGAHPGLADRAGFGRRTIALSPNEAYGLVLYQIGALAAIARGEGVELAHVKAHGALYNAAARDAALADALVAAVTTFDANLLLFGQPGTEHERAAQRAGVRFVAEVFADRAYRSDGRLVPRDKAGAVIGDPQAAAARVLGMVCDGGVRAVDGTWVKLRVDTVCVHGDSPRAVAIVRAVREVLQGAGVTVAPVGLED
jgi:UPF0271 protein